MVATIKDITEESAPQKREVIAESGPMRDVLNFVRRVAASEATTILLEGENGTGKDLVAKTLHYQSLRQAEPFIAINCAAIPDSLLESELFGYEKGAFTDARAQKRGIFELADKGTLFLDEVGEIPLMLQAKLLRVLEEQSFRRLGGLKDIQLDLRVVAATNKNLREAVKEGAFRQDLYFRLNVIQILIPPLRDRAEDIVPLTHFFIEHYNRKFKRNIEGVTESAAKLLLYHDWPGNVRELRNAIERAMILEESSLITPASLPIAISRPDGDAPHEVAAPAAVPSDGMSLEDNERSLLVRALGEDQRQPDAGRPAAARHPRYSALQDEKVQSAVSGGRLCKADSRTRAGLSLPDAVDGAPQEWSRLPRSRTSGQARVDVTLPIRPLITRNRSRPPMAHLNSLSYSQVRLLFTVTETFTVQGRGIVLLPELRPVGDEHFRVGDLLKLRRPDGREDLVPTVA